MSVNRKQEERYLSADESMLVQQTRQPVIAALADGELSKLRKLLRERRDRATQLARRQHREIRGKSREQGASLVSDDTGSKLKVSLLAQAMKRLNSEATRRAEKAARAAMVADSRRALAMKQAAGQPRRPPSRTSGAGMSNKPNMKAERIGDPREASRVSQFVKQDRARRDG